MNIVKSSLIQDR